VKPRKILSKKPMRLASILSVLAVSNALTVQRGTPSFLSSSICRGDEQTKVKSQLTRGVGSLNSVNSDRRRTALIRMGTLLTLPIFSSPSVAGALDMDAFVAGELAADKVRR
jgi:hypothetical protein